ncbi:MAG TPA: MerR family transcriptional regulator [Propionibacteriaceae bacterium]|nr:MerR family transcriptional regulator [Propionibacteriaceae bacterium]
MRDPVQRNVPPRPGGGGGDAARSGQPAEQSGATGTMSIGEVLGILKPEFPDITVSKIRFLEGAGLVQPDRSASGYRKFSEDDVARLRFVLRAQRDQYLPLRVIRQRLADLEQVGGLEGTGSAGAAGGAAPAAGGSEAGAAGVAASGTVSRGAGAPGAGAGASGAAAAGAGASGAGSPGASTPGAGTLRTTGPGSPGPAGAGAGVAGSAAAAGQPARGTGGGFAAAPPSDAQFTRDELCRAAGANVEQLLELESFGLVSARGSGERGAWYGGDDLVLLRLARELADYGLEARHLRMYKLFAEREAALFEQVVAPLVRQRNPEARARARDTIDALAQLGGRMRDLALRSAVHGMADTRDSHR